MDSIETRNLGWRVTAAATGMNLAFGVLYTWSVISGAIPASWGWSQADKALPYSVAVLIFSLSMIPAGRLQDRIGPRWVASIGGLFIGGGCMVAGMAGSSLSGFVVGFGVLGGIGIGFGYASATPPAVKWFPPSKTGTIAGIVVAGFGLASVYAAPLANSLLRAFATERGGVREMGISSTMMVFGILFLVAVVLFAQLLKNPPPGYVPATAGALPASGAHAAASGSTDAAWTAMVGTAHFWMLWIMFFCGAGVGLMIISTAKNLGVAALGEYAFWAVVVLAVGNAGGRILAGTLSDRIGRQSTMLVVFVLQAVMICLLIVVRRNPYLLLPIILIAGANYGANLALFPAASKDYFGLKSLGLNYGILFTAWGFGGLILSYANGRIQDAARMADGSLNARIANTSFYLAAGLLLAAAALTFVSRAQARKTAAGQ
ncbi:MAG: OFA family MFS transporter [Acidobacteriota bacterium]